MEILTNKVSSNIIEILENLRKNIFDINLSKLCEKKIGYINFYHKTWENNKYLGEINQIIEIINKSDLNNKIDFNKILYSGFIYSFPNCDNQNFHYDYSNKTTTYFIPLVKLTNLNGTEYLYFTDKNDYIKYSNLLLDIN
jgi:hypothetical protein